MRKALIALAAVGALLAGSLAIASVNPLGIAGAQEEEAPAEPTHQRRPMILDEALASLVDDGTITQEQSDAVKDRIRSTAEAGRGEGGGPGHPGPRGPGGMGLDAVAEAIGIDVEVLTDGLRGGQSMAEIAQANGVEPQAVIDALVVAAGERIDEAVANGRIEEDRAAEMKAGLVEKITAMVNGEGFGGRGPGSFGPGEGDHGGRGGSFGPGEPGTPGEPPVPGSDPERPGADDASGEDAPDDPEAQDESGGDTTVTTGSAGTTDTTDTTTAD